MPQCIRKLIFEAPSPEALLTALEAVHPGVTFSLRSQWDLADDIPAAAVPVWWWSGSADSFLNGAGTLHRTFVYPLLPTVRSFVIGFPFSRDVLRPLPLTLDSLDRLDAEDVGRLLCEDSLDTTWDLIGAASSRVAQTPIEDLLGRALEEAGLPVQRQVLFAGYRPDFLIEHRGRRLVVEADGSGFHDAAADRARDAVLCAHGVERVFRFTGSQIFRDAPACASGVRAHFDRAGHVREYAADSSLDESQARAAGHHAGAARVLAPAGAGKTKTMVAHVLELLRRGVPPGSILVLAFNKKAAEQLRQRLGHMGVPTSRDLVPYSDGVFCSTFHAFGYRYLKQVRGDAQRTEGDARVWRKLMEGALGDCGISVAGLQAVRGSDPLGQFLKAVDRAKADLQQPEEIVVEIESFGEKGNRTIGFGSVWSSFQRRQLDAGVISFDDHLYVTVRDLLQSPERRQALQDRFEHVLVDEFQDLNQAQLALVDILSRPQGNLFVVGDDDQLIYGWRFAKPSNILDFHQRVPPPPYSETYTLTTNYRCSRAVVETSRRLIDRNQRRERKDFSARVGAPEGVVRFVLSPSWNTRAGEIAEFLRTERTRLGCKWQQLAVLCRFKSQQAPMAMALDAASIPRSRLLRYRLYTQQAAILLRDYIDLVLRPAEVSGEQLGRILNRPNRYIKNAEVARICTAAHPWDALCGRETNGDLAPGAGAALVRTVEALHSRVEGLTAGALLENIVKECELERYWTDESRGASRMDEDEAGPFQVLRILSMLAEDRPQLHAFIGEWDAAREREVAQNDVQEDTLEREEPETDDHVVIGTIHSAKGREYQAVVLVDFDPDVSRMSDADLEEERRVLYVGVTRAQQSLLLTIDARKPVNPLVAELIAPRRSPDEEVRIAAEIARCQSEVLDYTALVERHREELRALEDGREAESLAATVQRLDGEIETQKQHLLAVGSDWNAVAGPTSIPLEQATIAGLRAELDSSQADHRRIQQAREQLAGELAQIRAKGGWWPQSENDRGRWEAEIDGLQRRIFELDIELDRLRTEGASGGLRALWARVTGAEAERNRKEQLLASERAKRAARREALLQGRNLAEELVDREAELGSRGARIQLLEQQLGLRARFEQAIAEQSRLKNEAQAVRDRLNVLRARPELLTGELRSRIDELETKIASANSRRASAESRLIELTILAA